ncbi:ligand-gated channel protein [Halioglobus sp. HI00S01]|uniref:TonB-dependent receptor n=1 Tax=Halioglobus sp. HI00S01 TaxID=1822214 RepID=UPI0007C24732|nr:TonB-dependent receptor [Halioglobus sp. HI00S01]KZX56151.1 ligand-gated channel protein [Halioglobus sp. HI00S01]
MKRLIPLAVAVAAANAALAQDDPAMEHVLVSVPLHKQEAETALPVTVLSGEELRRAAASTIGETLENKPGIANASFGPGVGQPVIRGHQGARVTVLQNGTSSADASNISADHAVSVEPMLADSIEVLRGPSTLLYGGGAIGGVVNVLDNRIPTTLQDEASGGLEYRHDTASDLDNVVGRFDGSAGNFAFHADMLYRDWSDLEIPGYAMHEEDHDEHDEDHDEHDEHDEEHEEHEGEEQRKGVLENTAGRTKSLTLGSAFHFDSGFIGLAVNRLENEYGIPAGGHGHHDEEEHEEHEEHEGDEHDEHDEHEGEEHDEHGHGDGITLDVEQTRYDVALHLHELPGTDVVRGFLTYTDYEHSEIEGNGEVGTTYSNETWEGRLEAVHQPMGNFHGVLGLQALSGEFSALGEEAFIPVTDNSEIGVFLVEDYHAGDWLFEIGARFDRDERDPDTFAASKETFSSFSASGSALWTIDEAWQLGAALSMAERAPTTEELYSNVEAEDEHDLVVHAATGAIEIGDANLDTETSNNIDLSVDWMGEDHSVTVTAYYNDFEDYIGLLATGEEVDETPVYVYNQQDAEFYGLEVETQWTLMSAAGGDLRLDLYGDITRAELDNGDDVPRLPPVRVGSRLMWSAENWELWASVIDAADQDNPGANEEETEGYTRWDLGGEYRFIVGGNEMVTFVSFKNISDEEIRLSTSFLREVAPEAGRSIEAGIRYSF